ncbi:MAG: hypothetical protein ABR886_10740, partial [Dehalococcoidales bacterium]
KLIQYPDYLLFGEALPFQVFPPWPILAFHLTIGTIFGEQVRSPLSFLLPFPARNDYEEINIPGWKGEKGDRYV